MPPASAVWLCNVEESWIEVPIATGPRFDNSVVIDGVFGLTTSVSSAQAEETGPVLLPSPE